MKNLNEIQKILVDAESIDEEIQRNMQSQSNKENYGEIMMSDIAESTDNDKMSDAYLKAFLLRMSRDIHTIKICVLIFSILALVGIAVILLLYIAILGTPAISSTI